MRLLVTAGPTREPIDPVRYISNRSSGKMGYAVARAAVAAGHEVVLVSGPVCLLPPAGVRLVKVQTAAEMLLAVRRELRHADALVMAAAVADWRPRTVARRKVKKAAGAPVLVLEPTTDILRTVARRKGRRVVVGFAAETGNPVPEARRKLIEKRLDMVVANDVLEPGAGFEVDTNRVVLVTAEGNLALPRMTKRAVGRRIVRWIEGRVGQAGFSRRPTQ